MGRVLRISLVLALLISFVHPATSVAVSSNPTPVCGGSTCTITFTYTGDFYNWNAPYTGTYTLEVWGSQGGTAGYNGTAFSAGGLGGYAKGDINLSSSSVVAIYVGGQGQGLTGTATSVASAGGWNGGGAGYLGSSTTDNRGAGGGGGTDIRIGGSALSNRVIVAGGGAGGAKYTPYGTNYPGVGGGTNGGDGGTANYGTSQPYNGKGGTQSAGGIKGSNCSSGSTDGALGQGGQSDAIASMGGAGGGGGYWGGGGSGCGMAGGGGSGYVGGVTTTTLTSGANVMPNPAGGTMTGNSGNGVARITYQNGPAITKFSPAQKITNSSSLTFDLIFGETVTGLTSADFSKSGTGSSTCTIGTPSGSGNTYTVTLTGCSVGNVVLTISANSVTNSGAQTGPTSNTAADTVTIDQTVPTISSVTGPANSTYIPGNTLTFTVNFSESVTVTGAPRLIVTVGSSTEYANYVSMTDSKTALFRYTVATDPIEFDTDGISVSTTLDLNSGTIRDLATNDLTLTFSAPTLTSVLVAQPAAAPTIDSIAATSGTFDVYFTAGTSRGSTTSNYQYSLNGGAWTTRATGTTASPLRITSLTDGTGYSVRLRAVTNAGNSDSSTAVTETPTAVVVTGQSTLVLTYGNSASTSAYSATGGNNSFTWSLGSSIAGVTLSGTTVTANNTVGAGTYTQTVRALDTSSQVGIKTLTITVNKASTSISIALPNSASTAAASGTVAITATVPRAGSVSFKEGSTVVCTSAASSTTATCSWTAPGTLGSVNLTAIFTPTDSTNYETSTSTTLTISVVNGVSTVSLSLAGGVTQTPKGQNIVITATIDQAGKVTFYADGKKLPGCINLNASAGTRNCTWKPAVQKQVTIKATLNPTNNVYQSSTSSLAVWVVRRTGTR
jgi:hypothetical protein